ncbi:DUF2730 family protein [Desulfopila inferna]|uniref:DUF2730 family protein n=1 Tax=Desulfopila inferna TaxID=468528 RepID=UPI001964DB46|nr:DUF2730 family protein [Desulfopila inferna]MBM9605954.1 DUF2730 family protein [Desulfopila inferna]
MIEDYTAWRFWFDAAQLAGTIAIGVYVWWDRRKKTTEKRFSALEEMVSGHAVSIKTINDAKKKKDGDCDKRLQRITDLEKDVHHLPSRQELTELSGKIGTLTEKLGTLDGRLSGINRAVDLLNQHHLRTD